MKKTIKNQLVTSITVAVFMVVGLSACSSKKADSASNSDRVSTPSTTAQHSADKANLGASSAGRGF